MEPRRARVASRRGRTFDEPVVGHRCFRHARDRAAGPSDGRQSLRPRAPQGGARPLRRVRRTSSGVGVQAGHRGELRGVDGRGRRRDARGGGTRRQRPGVRALAEACASLGARLVQPSTDYVFDGTALDPYPEDAPTCPVNAYGRTKLVGERAVLELLPDTGYVVRTAWLYGAARPELRTQMAGLEKDRATVEVIDDQFGQPTWTGTWPDRIVRLASPRRRPGSTTPPTPAGRAGTPSPGRSSRWSAPTRSGSTRSPPRSSRAPRDGRPTACWDTTGGAGRDCRRCGTGERRCESPMFLPAVNGDEAAVTIGGDGIAATTNGDGSP